MAAPPNKNIADLNGKWVMNKDYSSPAEPALALQGVGWMTRKVIGLATITLHTTQHTAPPSPLAPSGEPSPVAGPVTHIVIEQTGTAGMKGTTERRCLDGQFREHSDYVFGRVRGRTTWADLGDVGEDEFLKAGWADEGETGGEGGKLHVLSYVESVDGGWTATQVWGFKKVGGERVLARNIVVVKGSERVELNLYYDWVE